MFKQEFDPELNWFRNFKVFIDLGYLGFNNRVVILKYTSKSIS